MARNTGLTESDARAVVEHLGGFRRVEEAMPSLQERFGLPSRYAVRDLLNRFGLGSASGHVGRRMQALGDDPPKQSNAEIPRTGAGGVSVSGDFTHGDVDQNAKRDAAYFAGGSLHNSTTSVMRDPGDLEADDADLTGDAADRADRLRLRRLERKVGDKTYLARTIERSIKSAFEHSPPRVIHYTSPRPTIAHPTERVLLGLWSDIHFGLNVDPREVPGNAFSWQIAARRIAKLCVQLADWKPEHRDDTTLQLVLNGDIIAGVIHMDDAGQVRLTEQIHGATQILVAALYFLRQHFGRIRVLCLPGNHDRVTRERQMAQRWDAHSTSIYLALQWAFHRDPAIVFDVPRTGDGTWELPGGKALGYAAHGDVAPTIGNVSRGINTAKLEAQVNKLNASGEFRKPIRVMAWGHWHQGLIMPFANCTAVVNGCLIGAESFARVGCGIFGGGSPMQLMAECTEAYPFGDSRFVYVRDADTDSAYDRVVPTPTLDLSKVAA